MVSDKHPPIISRESSPRHRTRLHGQAHEGLGVLGQRQSFAAMGGDAGSRAEPGAAPGDAGVTL